MKILVPVKRAVDKDIKIRVKADGSGVDLANVKMSMNPFDEIAVEEAIRLKEAGKATEIVAVSIGPQQATDTIRTVLAMGADRGILVKVEGAVEPLTVAKILKGIADAPPAAPAKPAAAVFSASALAGIQQAIRRQIQPCADRQVDPGPGANRISVTLNLRLSRSGRLTRSPVVVRTSGVDDENERYEDRVKDLAVAAYVGCSPLTGLPAELYQTERGGWSNINMTYRLP